MHFAGNYAIKDVEKHGGIYMEFWSTLILTLIKMVIVGGTAFGGILLGKKLRERKNEKEKSQAEA